MENDITTTRAPDALTCSVVVNKTVIITNLYEGIPQTLILNIVGWVLLILLFTLLRHQAWDYGRLALVNSHGAKKRWTQLFYAHGKDEPPTPDANPPNNQHPIDRGLFSWIWVTLRLKKEEILAHSGPDAVHYLSFQQHLMVVMAIITFVSIVVILPINFQGTLSGDVNSFGHTTLSNLNPGSGWLWVHVFVAIAYVPLVVLVMRRSSGRNAFKKAPIRTIMVTNITSSNDRNKSDIRNYIQQLFPDVNIEDIQLAFNITKLTKKYAEYERCVEARIYCENHRDRRLIRVTPVWCSCNTVDASEYYQKEERNLAGEVARLRASALNEPLGIAFITVSTVAEAQSIIQHFRPGTYRDWQLSFAPQPLDIFWENLSVSTSKWYLKWTAVNLCLFLVLFFLTTPAYIVNLLDFLSLSEADRQKFKVSPVVSEFLPTLMLWTLSALMPVIVAYSDKWLSHWTRSQQNYSVMTKTFGYLLFMILILPSLGLTSAQALLEWTVKGKEQYRWECIFLPDKGAFFVNYVITAAFIGTALELIRFPELIVYVWMLCTAKSRAEIQYIRKSILIEFPFGTHYAWTVMVFTTSVVYSVACPLIMPFAMVYICFKHAVDRHNLYFAYGPSNMVSRNGGKIHSTAVTMTKFSVILLLTIMAAMAALRSQGFDARAIVLILSLCMSLTLFAFMSPIKRCTMRRPSIPNDRGPAPLYVADVLFARQSTTDHATYSGYGSDTRIELNTENGGDNVSVDI